MSALKPSSDGHWLSSAIEATIYSTSTWQPIQETVCQQLASYIRSRQSEGAQVVQGLLLLTGERFSVKYLADISRQRELLYEPFMSGEGRNKLCKRLEKELQQWSELQSHTVITPSFSKSVVDIVVNAALEGYVQPPANGVGRRSNIVDDQTKTSVLQNVAAQSEKVAEGLVSLYRLHPELTHDPSALIGLKLCPALRAFIWECRLVQRCLTLRIRVSIAESIVARNLASIDASPLKPLIERILVMVAKDRDFISESLWNQFQARMSVCIDVMNRFHIYTGKYGARYCALLLNMIQAFPKVEEVDEILSLYTALTNQRPLQAVPEYAEEVVQRVAERDPELYEHITNLGRTSLLIANLDRGAKGLAIALNLSRVVCKWLEYGLVGFLQPNQLLFVWDQCMLIGWDSAMTDICLAILELLRLQILKATTIEELDHVTVLSVADLSLKSIRERFLHLRAADGSK